MYCSKCGKRNDEDVSFCRSCGTHLEQLSLESVSHNLPNQSTRLSVANAKAKDPDELTSNGIGGVIVGDGFFMVAVMLSAIESSVQSLLWLFLLIPAFYYFGRGFSELLHARQIRQREQRNELRSASVAHFCTGSVSGELTAPSSVIERTTRDLK